MIYKIEEGSEAWEWLEAFFAHLGPWHTLRFELRGNDRIAFKANEFMWSPSLYVTAEPKQ